MNTQEKINSCLRLVSPDYRLVKNAIRVSGNPKMKKHELAKFLKAFELICDGYEVYTEVVFRNKKGRADILVPERFQVIEILDSETDEKLESKKDYYPPELDIVALKAEDIIEEHK